MRILLVTDTMDLGGAETHILTLARALTEAGEEVSVCSGGGRLAERLQAYGILHHMVPFARRTPFGVALAMHKLRCLLKKGKYDVVHAHARYPAVLCKLLSRYCARFVTTCHAAYPPGIRACIPWHGQHVFAVSEDLRAGLLAERTLPPGGVTVVRNAVYVPAEPPTRVSAEQLCGLAASAHRILAVHRMDRDTIQPARLLLAMLPHLRSHYPDAQLVLVGDGDALGDLRALLTEGAVLAGGVTDPTPYLATADLLVGVSRSALEAMLVGVPVILAGREGFGGLVTADHFGEMQTNNFTGRGMKRLEKETLYDAIIRFFSMQKDQRASVARSCKALASAVYDPRELASRTLQGYHHLQPRNAPREALIVGYLGCENLGDDGMLLAERQQLSGGVCLAHTPRRAARTYGMPCYGRYDLFAVWRILRQTKRLVLGGGSLLQNKTSQRSLLYYATIFYLAGLCGARRVILANGLGPLRGRWAKRMVAWMLTRADAVTLRDPVSRTLAETLGVKREIGLCPDPALCISSDDPPCTLPQSCRLICIRHNAGAQVVEAVSSLTDTPLAFLAMQPCDQALAARLAAHTGGILLPQMTIGALVGLLASGQVREVVTMRYHLALLAARHAIPTLAIGEDPKLHGLAAMGLIPPPVAESKLTPAHLSHITCGIAVPFASAVLLGKAIK